jgi:autoinducer 2 (AI-2) kinase
MVTDEPLIDPDVRLRTLCHTLPGRWMIEGIGFYCGIVMRWFRDGFCELEAVEAAQTGEDIYTLLERKGARVSPGANGVFAVFSNLMQANRWVHASPSFIGFNVDEPAHAARIDCFRAIEESAAYVSRGHLRIIEPLAGVEVGEVVLTGGAAKGELWPQILADTLMVPVRVPEVKESTALGAAIYAGVGCGAYQDPAETAAGIVGIERTFEPDEAAGATYDHLYERWAELYRRSLELCDDGLVRPLWRAAGT